MQARDFFAHFSGRRSTGELAREVRAEEVEAKSGGQVSALFPR